VWSDKLVSEFGENGVGVDVALAGQRIFVALAAIGE